MDLQKILPKNGPPINEVIKYIEKYKNDLICLKYGGNVFLDREIFNNFIEDLSVLNKLGLSIIVIHGGGPRIKKELEKSNIQSKFIRGLRITDEKIINIVENVLIDFNDDIVNSLEKTGSKAVSIHTKSNNAIEVIPEAKELGLIDGIESESSFFKSKFGEKTKIKKIKQPKSLKQKLGLGINSFNSEDLITKLKEEFLFNKFGI